MPSTYKITAVHGSREWQPQNGGPNIDFTIEIDGLDGKHTLTQKKEGPHAPPRVGDEIFGSIVDQGNWPSGDPKPPKLKREMQGSGFRAQHGGSYNSPERVAADEAKGRAQGRAHAQEMALRWFGLKGAPAGLGDLTAAIDWFYKDAQAAKAEDYNP